MRRCTYIKRKKQYKAFSKQFVADHCFELFAIWISLEWSAKKKQCKTELRASNREKLWKTNEMIQVMKITNHTKEIYWRLNFGNSFMAIKAHQYFSKRLCWIFSPFSSRITQKKRDKQAKSMNKYTKWNGERERDWRKKKCNHFYAFCVQQTFTSWNTKSW